MKVCPHDIDRDLPCSLCATSAKCKCNFREKVLGDGCDQCNPEYARTHASGDDGEGGQVLCVVGSEKLCDVGRNPFGDAGDADENHVVESGIWLITLKSTDGRDFFIPALATDGRAIELIHAGFQLQEMDSLEDAMMAAEMQGNMQ